MLCYLVLSKYHLELCLPALRIYSLVVIVAEIAAIKCCIPLRKTLPESNNTTPLLGKGKTKNKSSKIADVFLILLLSLCSICGIHIVTVLYGAYFIENVEETLTFSILVASLALIRPLITLGPKAFQILLERLNWEDEPDLQCVVIFVGAWLGALPIPLDWDTPWQVWPLTCCIGAIFGEVCASVYLLTKLILTESIKQKNKAT